MRKLMLSALLGLSALGFTAANPTEAKASWLSEALNRSNIEVNVGPQYPYSAPVYAPAPVYPVYRPVPTYTPPAYSYYPSYPTPAYSYYPTYPTPVYTPAPVYTVPAYRPAPVFVPQNSYYGPNRWDNDRRDHDHDRRDNRNDHDWRR